MQMSLAVAFVVAAAAAVATLGTLMKARGFEYVIIHYRWAFVCLFLLPISVVHDFVFYVRNKVIFKLRSAPDKHDERVKHVQQQVREWIKDGRRVPMCTARPGWQNISFRRGLYKKKLWNIDVNMIDIVEVDTKRKVVRVEPMVNMGQITACLNPIGWTIPVLPELDDLTVGGLIMGVGIETSSHKYGLFQHCCLAYELVLADGSLVRCSKEEDPELFYAVPWSYGTLGFLVAAEISIVPAKKYMRLEYFPEQTRDGLLRKFEEETNKPTGNEFVEALAYGKDKGVVMTGTMADEAKDGAVNAIGNWYKPWFFKHVEAILRGGQTVVEYIPLRHYYHRHSRSIFWELQDIVPFGNNVIFRYLLGWATPPKVSLLKLTQGEAIKRLYEERHIVQDMLVPLQSLSDALGCFHQELELYPLWLCPFLLPAGRGMVHSAGDRPQMFVDIGAYGNPQRPGYNAKEALRRIEKFVLGVGGFQMLYADSYLTLDEFRRMFDHSLYDQMRHRLDCEKAFPIVYDKVNRKARD